MKRPGMLAVLILALLLGTSLQAAAQPTGVYVLGSGDVLQVSVWGHDDLTQVIAVRPDGKISFPLVGELTVAGQAPQEAADLLTRGLSAYLKNPVVTVTVKEFRLIAVQVAGQVKNPGVYRLRPGAEVADALAAAGGLTPDADPARVSLSDPAQGTSTLDLGGFFLRGDQSGNREVDDGAQVVVAKVVRRATVLGQVRTPGAYPIEPETHLIDLIGTAGGPTDRAALEAVRIYRGGRSDNPEAVTLGRDHLLFEGKAQDSPLVQPGDVVVVPETKKIDWDKVLKLLTGLDLIRDLFR